jgi:preprotein translocase subunit SecA
VGLDEGALRKSADSEELPSEGSLYDGLSPAQFGICGCINSAVHDVYEIKVQTENPEALDHAERYTILTSVDRLWREHLYAMDGLRQSVHLRSYGQKDPLVEYKTEARDMFIELMANIKEEVCRSIFLTASSLESVQNLLRSLPTEASHQMANALGLDPSIVGAGDMVSEVNAEVSQEEKARPVRAGPKVGRNDPCPCGSGKKYKKCCGR